MAFELLRARIAPAEGENAVRSYHCTSLSSRLLSLKAEGYLTVTNKRIVFYASGSSYAGHSVLLSEVPIADVSGVSSYKGTFFSLTHLITAAVISFIAGNLISAIATALIFSLVRDRQTMQALSWILPIAAIIGSFFVRQNKILRSILAASGTMFLFGLGGLNLAIGALGGMWGGSRGGVDLLACLGPLAGIYAIVCFFLYARRETMSLTVGSKGGSSTPIAISGVSAFGLYNAAALRALTAEPAVDAEVMIRELGAVITDIQALGDFGVQKWIAMKVNPGSPQ